MHNTIPLSAAALIALAVTVIGSSYVISPQGISKSFGLKPPAYDPDTLAWLRLKGIRDVGCGLAVFTLMLLADHRTLGAVLIALAIIPLGDMLIVLASKGSKSAAFSIHGATFAVMLAAGLALAI
jgi:hypothetical protein